MNRLISGMMVIVVASAVLMPNVAEGEPRRFVRGSGVRAAVGRSVKRSTGIALPSRGPARTQLATPKLSGGRVVGSGLAPRRTVSGIAIPQVAATPQQGGGFPTAAAAARRISPQYVGPGLVRKVVVPSAAKRLATTPGTFVPPPRNSQALNNGVSPAVPLNRPATPAIHDAFEDALASSRGLPSFRLPPLPERAELPEGTQFKQTDGPADPRYVTPTGSYDYKPIVEDLILYGDALIATGSPHLLHSDWAALQELMDDLYGRLRTLSPGVLEHAERLAFAQRRKNADLFAHRNDPDRGGPPNPIPIHLNPSEALTPSGGTLVHPGRGSGGGGGNTTLPGGGTVQEKGDDGVDGGDDDGDGGGGNDDDNGGGQQQPAGGGRDHDAHPHETGGDDGGAGDTPAGGAAAGGAAGGAAGSANGGSGGKTTYESRSSRDPWGYVADGVEVQTESSDDELPPADEAGGGGRGSDVGARSKLPNLMSGVTPQERDLIGAAFGATTGPDDKDRPNTGGQPRPDASNPNDDLGDDLPGRRRPGGNGGESMVGFGEWFFDWLGIDPEIAY